MSDLYVGIVENPFVSSCIRAVAIASSMTKALEMTECWIQDKGDSTVRYRIRICEIDSEWIDSPQGNAEVIKAILGQIRL